MLNLPRNKRSFLPSFTSSSKTRAANTHTRTNSTDSFAPLIPPTTSKTDRISSYQACSTTTTTTTTTMTDTQKMPKFFRGVSHSNSGSGSGNGMLQTAFIVTTTTMNSPGPSPTTSNPSPKTPTFSEMGMGRHSNKWLFDAESWRRLLASNRNEKVHRS